MIRIKSKTYWEVKFNVKNSRLVRRGKKQCTIRAGYRVWEGDTLRLVDHKGNTIKDNVAVKGLRTVLISYTRGGFNMLVDGCVLDQAEAEAVVKEVGFDLPIELIGFLKHEYGKMPNNVFEGQLISW